MQGEEHGQRYYENQPSGEGVKKDFCFLRIPVLHQQTRAKNAQGKSIARKNCQPRKYTIRPAISSRREIRDRKSSAPNTPMTSTQRAETIMPSPQIEGAGTKPASRPRSCHNTNKANAGTK